MVTTSVLSLTVCVACVRCNKSPKVITYKLPRVGFCRLFFCLAIIIPPLITLASSPLPPPCDAGIKNNTRAIAVIARA